MSQQNGPIPDGGPEGGKSRRIYLLLRDAIASGRLADGASLPGEQRLAERHGVSRATIRAALDSLSADGLVVRRAGAGTLVRAPSPAAAVSADMADLVPRIDEIGRTTARLLSFSYGPAPAAVAEALGLADGAVVQTAVRVRLLGDTPFSHLTTHVPEAIARDYTEADLATTPLFRLLERGGVKVDAADQTVTATLAAPGPAEALGAPVGAPLLALTRVVRDAEGQGVEHLSALYRPELFRLEMRLARVGAGGDRHWRPVLGDAAEGSA